MSVTRSRWDSPIVKSAFAMVTMSSYLAAPKFPAFLFPFSSSESASTVDPTDFHSSSYGLAIPSVDEDATSFARLLSVRIVLTHRSSKLIAATSHCLRCE